MFGARIRLSPATLMPTMIHVQGGDLTLSRCWLGGPLTKSSDAFKALITVANASGQPATLLMRDNVCVSGQVLIHTQENVQVKARNNVLVSLGDGVLFETAAPTAALLHIFEHNTFAVRHAPSAASRAVARAARSISAFEAENPRLSA